MNWTCEQTELRLSDYLDGLLTPEEQHAFDAHVNTCALCTPLVASVSHLITNLHSLEPVEVPPRLIYSILDQTLGPREEKSTWRSLLDVIRGFAAPKILYGAVCVAATFLVVLTASGFSWRKPRVSDLSPSNVAHNLDRQSHLVYARFTKYASDLRVVYEIQSRLRQDDELPNSQDNQQPQQKQAPGQTDSTPSAPRQQNRANDLAKHMQILAAALPVLHEGRIR